MRTIQFSPLGRRTFLTSFLLGTFLLITFWMTKEDWLLISGFYYVMITAVVNMLILLYELIEYLNDVSGKKQSGNSVLLLLVNIPVSIGYFYIFMNIV
ncbi:hypothetical protein [Chryseobacterium pennipullorum]|nr:hypothetical protein [Chryseobacterium pennipullorum]